MLPPPAQSAPAELLHLLLTISVSGVMLLRPLYKAGGGTIQDFSWVQLNPAAQQLLRLPECPAESFLTLFPAAKNEGVFGFYCEAFLAEGVAYRQHNYHADGLGGYFLLAAQRHADVLVVSFTNTHEQPFRAASGQPTGTLASAPATEPVLIRQQLQTLNQELKTRGQRTHELTEQQRLLNQILGQVPAFVATFSGPEHRLSFFNAPYQVLAAGRARLGSTVAEAFPEMVAQGLLDLLDHVYDTGEPHVGNETPVRLHDARTGQNEQRYVDFVYQPLRDAQQRVEGILAFVVEVTERVRTRQHNDALQAELLAQAQMRAWGRETFYQIFAETPAAICIQRGPEHRYEYANQAYHNFFPGRELLGKTVAEALPETVDSGVVGLLDRVYRTGETYYGYELPLLIAQPAGPPRQMYFTFTYQAYREQGEIVGISTFAYDVAEQVQARREREAQQQLLATVFEQAPVGIFVVKGPTYVLEVVNEQAAALLGHSQAQLLGRPYFEAVPELVGQGFPDWLRQVWESGQAAYFTEVPAQLAYHPPGQLGYFNFVYQPLRDAHGQLSSIACVAVEVTEQVLARQQVQALNEELTTTNNELSKSNRQLTRTNVDLDTFVYMASHDLKAPITNIEGILHALRATLPPAVLREDVTSQLLSMLQGATERFRATIDQLTDVSRLQQAQNLPSEHVPLAPVVEAVRLDMLGELQQAGAQLVVHIGPEVYVQFAPKNLRSVVYNLLSNAVKYRHPDRPAVVTLRAACIGSQLELVVQDNGLGLDAPQRQRLFSLFQRLHTHVEGTGVGLYMVKRMVENAGGTITVQSELGIGTTFTVTLQR